MPGPLDRFFRTPSWPAVYLTLALVWTAVLPVSRGDEPSGRAFAAAEDLFRQDSRWQGSDGAISAPIGGGRMLFAFDDTFIAPAGAHDRSGSTLVRNSIAVLDNTDPAAGRMHFYWGHAPDGAPVAFFPGDGGAWYWTGDATLLDQGPLVVFLFRTVDAPDEDLGFANAGFALAVIHNPADPPESWAPVIHPADSPPFDAVPGSALIRDGDRVVALAIREQGRHAGTLVRYRSAALAEGDLSEPEWWAGAARGWVAEADLGAGGPAWVLDDAGAESSIHRDERIDAWVHVAAYGFGAATIGIRTAPALTGPWSDPVTVYAPPENGNPDLLVYGAMAHPELQGPCPGDLVVTYATNARRFEDLFTAFGARHVYWPRAIAVNLTASAD